MNIKITHSWLKEFLETDATAEEIQKYLSISGPSIERLERTKDGDYIYDIEITSNRVDTASVVGIAREAATILTRFEKKAVFKPPQFDSPVRETEAALKLTIEDPGHLCHRLLAVVMDNVSVKPSEPYVAKRLEAAGIRSLNNLVDITNYVMLEIGHPSHVFDYDRIKTHTLLLRQAKEGEPIETLDHKSYKLSTEDIVIDDGTGRVIDLPGIMGTANSVVTPDTKRIIFFIESNDARSIRRSSMRYGIRTMAATINEKSPDPEDAKKALYAGVGLYKKLAGARIASDVIDLYPHPQAPKKIETTVSYINKRIGINIPAEEMQNILTGLGFSVKNNGETLEVGVPSFRYHDINIPADIVEEVARIFGYDNLPNRLSPVKYVKQPKEMEELFVYQSRIKLFLKHLGLNEVLNYSMISEEMIVNCGFEVKNHLELANVMSEEIKYLRTSLLPSLIRDVKINEGRKETLKLFEVAKVYNPRAGDLPEEVLKVGLATTTTFADLKGIIEALFSELHLDKVSFKTANNDLFTSKQAAIYIGDKLMGKIGMLKSSYAEKNKLRSQSVLAELDFKTLVEHAHTISRYVPLHPYAIVKQDLTIKKAKAYEDLKRLAFDASSLLQKMEYVSMFKDNITLRFYFSSNKKNITEEEAKQELSKIQSVLYA